MANDLKTHNFVKQLFKLQESKKNILRFQRNNVINNYLLNRIGLETELSGHKGCVNCVEWNSSGSILASGSDDYCIKLWDPFRHKLLKSITTSHHGNIFSVKFMPNSSDSILVSGAADSKICVHDSYVGETTRVFAECQARVKRLAISPSESNLFWSASEDGMIMQFDIRCGSNGNGVKDNILINLSAYCGTNIELKCVAINPTRPYMIAVGANDQYARVYDRRMLKTYSMPNGGNSSISQLTNPDKFHIDENAVEYYAPFHLQSNIVTKKNKQLTITYLTFSPNGRELLVNLGGEQVYLYNLFRKEIDTIGLINLIPTDSESRILKDEKDNCNLKQSDLLKQKANDFYGEEKYSPAIQLYNEAIKLAPTNSVLYSNRAAALMNRKWNGDEYCALKDCLLALKLDPQQKKPFFRTAKLLYSLGALSESEIWLNAFRLKFPDSSSSNLFKNLKEDIEKSKLSQKKNNVKSEYENDKEFKWREKSKDFYKRFCGHCNTTTDIKEANFWGDSEQFILAGSDDGSFFVWDRNTENIVRVFKGDDSIVNCLQPHPSACLLATSGIDNVIRLWSPLPENSKNEKLIDRSDDVAMANQKRMNADPLEMMLMTMGGYPLRFGDSNLENNNADSTMPCRPS